MSVAITFLQTRELPAMVLELVVTLQEQSTLVLSIQQVMLIKTIMTLVILVTVMQVTELVVNLVLLTIQTTSSMID